MAVLLKHSASSVSWRASISSEGKGMDVLLRTI